MKLSKSVIALTLSMTIGASMFAGCTKAVENEVDGKGKQQETTSQTEATKEPVTLRMITHEGKSPSADSKVYKILQDKLNVNIEVIETTGDNRGEKVNIMLATGDIPDLFFADIKPSSEEMVKWMKQGLILSYDEYMDSYPNLKKQLTKFEEVTALTNNKFYMLPIQKQIGDYKVVNDHIFWVRKDYMKNLGRELPTNFEEFNDLLYAMTFEDPDQNGVDDTFGISFDNTWWLYSMYNLFDTSTNRFEQVDGKWRPEVVTDNMKEAIKYMSKLYKDGVMDPEFMISKNGRVFENFVSGKAGVMFKNGGFMYNTLLEQFGDAYPDKDPEEAFTWLPIVSGPYNTKRLDGGANYWGSTFIGNTGDEEKIKKSMELLDFLASKEGQDLFFYGIEGEHYKVENGEKISLIPDSKNVAKVDNHGQLGHLALWLDGLFTSSVANSEKCKENYQASMEAATGNPLLYVDVKFDNTIKKTVKEYTRETIISMITESKDIDKDFEEFAKQWYKKGGQKWVEAIEEAAK